MSEAELMGMSQRERDRLKVLHEVQKGHLRQKQVAGGADSSRPTGSFR